MFSDDALSEELVLKGGNAVNLVYNFGSRSSLDIDLSIPRDFQDLDRVRERVFYALRNRFSAMGLTVFDEGFEERPLAATEGRRPTWGGYEISFKLIPTSYARDIHLELERMRREAVEMGPAHERIFRIHISTFEYCANKTQADLEAYTIYVYTPAMLACEKLRAICQQMPEYLLRTYKTARARDFYDIHAVVTRAGLDMAAEDQLDLTRHIFGAKMVPLDLIPKIAQSREFHRPDWASVRQAVSGELKEFDFYFDFVVEQARLLEPLWNVDPPVAIE